MLLTAWIEPPSVCLTHPSDRESFSGAHKKEASQFFAFDRKLITPIGGMFLSGYIAPLFLATKGVTGRVCAIFSTSGPVT